MPFALPFIPSVANYRVGITLEQLTDTALVPAQFLFDVHWNGRDSAWYMDVRAIDETLISGGNRIVPGVRLGRFTDRRFPPGMLAAVDNSGQGRDPTFDDLGVRVQVVYYTLEELL